MENLDIQIKSLQNKILLLLKQNQLVIKQNLALQNEAESLRKSLKEKNDQLQRLNQQIDIIKLSGNALANDEKKLLEKRIDTYLADIEKCISILNA